MRAAGRKEGEVAAYAWRGGSKVGKKSEPLVAASREVGEGGACGGRGGRLLRPPAVRWERGQSVVEEGAIYEMPVHTWCIHLVQFHSHCYQLPLRYIPASFE